MNKIIPFEKEVVFKNSINEITSISLEHQLSVDKLLITGNFIISGEYKVSENSSVVDKFNLDIPLSMNIDDSYITDKAVIDIDDFYYEIINNNILKICIDLKLDNLEEKLKEELVDMDRKIDVLEASENDIREDVKKEEVAVEKEIIEEKMDNIFSNTKHAENYISYNIYIIREGDTIETILEKYKVTEDILKNYNDLSNLQIGDKIIVPNL